MGTKRQWRFDSTDYRIFLSLHRNPLQSNSSIAREIGISTESVRQRLNNLRKQRFLRPTRLINEVILGTRTQTEVEAVYAPSRLGLRRHHVLFEDIPDRRSLDMLKHICDVHPYSHYRALAYSKGATLYAQFDIPPSIEKTMCEFYDELVRMGLARKSSQFFTNYVKGVHADFTRWNINENVWNLEVSKASVGGPASIIETLWNKYMETHENDDLTPVYPHPAFGFDRLDMLLLRELTVNAKPSVRDLATIYKRDPTNISRRLKKLRELVAPQDMLYFNRGLFDLTYTQIIAGRIREGSDLTLGNLMGFIGSGTIPFDCKCVSDGSEYIVYITTPPSLAAEFSEFFWEHTRYTGSFQLQLDSARTYYFYCENYAGDGEWRTDKEYVYDEPLSSVLASGALERPRAIQSH
ncbi:MAG: AsnC family transcriptional regulator [Candidatus Thorarchaeota archaeon]